MSFLDDLLTSTRRRIEETKRRVTDETLEQRIASRGRPRDLSVAISQERVTAIAEIKRATPSKGPLALDLDAAVTAAAYARGGAAAISVLTDPDHFRGSLEDLEHASTVGLPTLRKDFVIDPFQIIEGRAAGADSVLLIVRALGPELADLVRLTRSLGMEPLVEVHDEPDLERAMDAGARIVGVNHRDLETFELDPERTLKLAPRVPPGVILVALSGVSTRREVEVLEGAGARAVLVGEALVTSPDPAAKLRELLGAGG